MVEYVRDEYGNIRRKPVFGFRSRGEQSVDERLELFRAILTNQLVLSRVLERTGELEERVGEAKDYDPELEALRLRLRELEEARSKDGGKESSRGGRGRKS